MTRPRFELGSLKTTNRHLTCKEMDHLSKRLDYFSPILGPVAQWIRHLTTNQGIPGSSPGRVEIFYSYFVRHTSLLVDFSVWI